MTLLRWLTFLLGSLAMTLMLFMIYFFLSDVSLCSTMAFPPLGNSYHVVASVSIDFQLNSQQEPVLLDSL